jgi:hypothetical protein
LCLSTGGSAGAAAARKKAAAEWQRDHDRRAANAREEYVERGRANAIKVGKMWIAERVEEGSLVESANADLADNPLFHEFWILYAERVGSKSNDWLLDAPAIQPSPEENKLLQQLMATYPSYNLGKLF